MSEYFQKIIKKQQTSVPSSSPIKFWTQFRNCVLETFRKREWKEVENDSDWDICWVEKETVIELFDRYHINANQKVNHFRNHFELTRKDLMIRNLKKHKRALEKEGKLDEAAAYNFFPVTYTLPNQYNIFTEEFKKANHAIWIMKPIGKSQGKGIFLFKKLSQISDWKNDPKVKEEGSQVENYIVQRYIHNPLLIGGKKFDLRIYCLVTSYVPLVAYLYRDGFARFTHHRYDNTDISNTYVHLTNVAIQKHSENYDKKIGGKWDLRTLKLYLLSKYGQEKVNKCFSDIQQLIIRTLLSVQKVIVSDKRCFELYGFDILIDAHLKPWVLEVNGSPSMTANTQIDCELKCGLLDDVLTIIDMEKILTGQEEQIGGFDLIYKGSPVQNEANLNSSMLGCDNNRLQQLKKLSKLIYQKITQKAKEQLQTEQRKGRDKEGLQPVPMIGLDSISNPKFRSKSTGKAYVNTNPASTLGLNSSKIQKNVFNQRQNLLPLSQEGREIKDNRENRERRGSSQQNRVRISKGKVIDLPPVNNHLVGLNLSSNATSTISNNTLANGQKKPLNTNDTILNGNNIVNSAMSTASQINSSEINLNQIQRKLAAQSNLSSSLPPYPIKGVYGSLEYKMNKQLRDSSLVQLSEVGELKEKNDKNLLSTNWQAQPSYPYTIEKMSSFEKKLREDLTRDQHLKLSTMEDPEKNSMQKNDNYEEESLSNLCSSYKDVKSQLNSGANHEE